MNDSKKSFFSHALLAVLILVQTSCSTIKPITKKTERENRVSRVSPDQVELGLPENSVQAQEGSTTITPTVTPPETTVRLGDRGGDAYTEAEETSEDHPVVKKLRIGLSLGPGLYRTINFVSVLKFLERQNLAPQTLTGTGFGAIVAAMYSNGMTPEVIEWNFYRYFKEKNRHRVYTEEWFDEVDHLLLEKFKHKKIEDSPKKFYITLFDAKTKKTYYFDKGNIHDLLLMNLRLTNGLKAKKQTSRYTAAFENEAFNANLMKRLGIDFTIGADVLGAKFDFEDSNEFLIGVYGRAAGRISREKKQFDYFYSIPLEKMSLDSTENGALFLMETQKYVEAQSNIIKKKIQQKLSSVSEL